MGIHILTPTERLDRIQAAIAAIHPTATFIRRHGDLDIEVLIQVAPAETLCVPLSRAGIPDTVGNATDIGWWASRALQRIDGGLARCRGDHAKTSSGVGISFGGAA